MNLNYNINNTLLGKNRNFLLGKVEYYWQRGVSVAAGLQSGSIIFGTGSITYTPYAPTTLFVSGTYVSEQLGSGSALGLPVDISVTGSGVWPTTGSNVLYINVGGNLGFNNNTSSIFSAAAGNMNLSSGSKISSSFTPIGIQEYNINFGLTHIKGNIYNPLVTWKAQNLSPVTTTGNVNGYTASLNIVKNVNEPLAYVKEVTSSFSSSFQYQYNFGVTASLTASINNVTGSTTMSIEIPQAGVSASQQFFNETTTEAKLTGSFAASNDNPYNITASVIFNKGNISNSNINWKATGSLEYTASLSSSFIIKKDANTPVTLVTVNNIQTNSTASTFTNNYAFDITASLSASYTTYYTADSASIIVAKSNIIIPEIGSNVSTWSTSSYIITSSFKATTGISNYNITASVDTYAVPFIEYIVIGGGGAGAFIEVPAPSNSRMGGGGAGGLITGSGILIPDVSYPVVVGAGGLKNQVPYGATVSRGNSGESSSFNGINALGGGWGGFFWGTPFNLNVLGAKNNDDTNPVGSGGGNFGSGSVGQGNNGFIIGGGGAGSGMDGYQWLNGVTYAAGGGGVGVSGPPNPGQRNFTPPGQGYPNFGSGGNGNDQLINTDNGVSGSVIIRYKATSPRASGGLITSASGYIYHTFTQSDSFIVSPTFNYTLIGGGGGGSRGISLGAGAGGAGGTIYQNGLYALQGESFNVTIGAGGIGEWNRGETPLNDAENGGATILTGLYNGTPFTASADGGTAGTKPFQSGGTFNGGDGGDSGTYLGGAGNSNTNNAITAGGGGAAAGFNGGPATIDTFLNVGKAGAGATSSLAGYAGGGGGGAVYSVNSAPGSGNDGGGNGGWVSTILVGSDATPNTGAGGGGGSQSQLGSVSYYGGNGGSGIAFLSYNGTGSKATGGTISYNASTDTTLHTFTTSGIFTWIN